MILGLVLATGWFLPWWGFLPLLVLAGCLESNQWRAFRVGALAVGLAWAMVTYYLDLKSHGATSRSLAGLVGLKSGYLLMCIVCVGGALLGGLATWLGSCARALMRPSRPT